MPLRADLASQLQSVDNSLLLVVKLLLYKRFLNLHCQVLSHYLDDLIIGRIEPERFVCLLVYFGFYLDCHKKLLFFENDWLG